MDLPLIAEYQDLAIDIVVHVINDARAYLGCHLDLEELARSRDIFYSDQKTSFGDLQGSLVTSSENLIRNAIERTWKLTSTFEYTLKYLGKSQRRNAVLYFHEAVFSQPRASYPIPQVTTSVLFTVQPNLLERPGNVDVKKISSMTFRVEGHNTDHDIRFVSLTADWLLAFMMMKLKLFKRIESIRLF